MAWIFLDILICSGATRMTGKATMATPERISKAASKYQKASCVGGCQ